MKVVEHFDRDRVEFLLEWKRITGNLPYDSWLLRPQAE